MSKESFILYTGLYEPIKELAREDKGDLLDAIFRYHINGSEPEKTSSIYMAFMFFKNQFRIDAAKYEKIVERNRSNGKLGGRPAKEETDENPKNPVGLNKPKKPDNGNDTDTGNENQNANDYKYIAEKNFDLLIKDKKWCQMAMQQIGLLDHEEAYFKKAIETFVGEAALCHELGKSKEKVQQHFIKWYKKERERKKTSYRR